MKVNDFDMGDKNTMKINIQLRRKTFLTKLDIMSFSKNSLY